MTDRLRFGTAGLRAALGDGPLRMNTRVVEQAAMAIASWLPESSTVIIGADARYGSRDFANVTARVLEGLPRLGRAGTEEVTTWQLGWAATLALTCGLGLWSQGRLPRLLLTPPSRP